MLFTTDLSEYSSSMDATSTEQKKTDRAHRIKSCPQPFDLIFQVVCCKDSSDTEFTEARKIIELFRQNEEAFDLDDISASGMTALTQCVLDGNLQSVKALIALGANVNTKDRRGNTALHHAASEGYIDIVKYLLNCNADARALNRQRLMPLEMADGKEIKKILSRHSKISRPVSTASDSSNQPASRGEMRSLQLPCEASSQVKRA